MPPPPALNSSQPTIYFDGSCPVCRAEIGYYRKRDVAGALCFVDVSRSDCELPPGLTRGQAMARFHVRGGNGQLSSGAAAFIEVWSRLPRWRWLARAAAIPGAALAMEFGYRLFLRVRPAFVRIVGVMLRPKRKSD